MKSGHMPVWVWAGMLAGCLAGGSAVAADAVKVPVPVPSPADSASIAAVRPKTEDVGVKTPPPGEYLHSWTYTDYAARVTQFAGLPVMNGGVAFVGDSLTDFGRWSDAWPNLTIRNFGIVGDTTLGLEYRLNQVIKARPDRIFVLIGTNDIEYGRPIPEIAANIDHIIARLQLELPRSKIFLQSVLPRQPQFDEPVRAVNKLIRKVAETRKVTFVDLYPHFVAEGGRLDPSVTLDDTHLAGKGYARWRALIQDYVYTPAGQKAEVRLPHRNRPTLNKKVRS